MLVRPREKDGSGLEVLLMRRSAESAFAPRAYVFPGGVLDSHDVAAGVGERAYGLSQERVARDFRSTAHVDLPVAVPAVSSGEAAGLYYTALRELFEEAGVVIARDLKENPIVSDCGTLGIVATRQRVRLGSISYEQALANKHWTPDASALTLFSHWITPETEPHRYDTYFFLAVAPHGLIVEADETETSDQRWMAPQEALDIHAQGRLYLVYPTIKHLQRLATFGDVTKLQAFAREKPIYTIVPNAAEDDETYELPASLDDQW